jgi:DNA-binding transcriptional MerR regulator
MSDSLDIAEIARLTGLTSRALRFYEARGLVSPLRTASGRRHYGPAELERLHQIVTMKRAGLTLAQIQRMANGKRLDLRALVEAQIEVLHERERDIATARKLLKSILSRIDRSEPIDVATFCSLIRNGETTMSEEKWAEIHQRYMSADQLKAFEAAQAKLPADYDQDAHDAKWKDLDRRIVAALPMDPASPQAQAFLDEWDALIQPFLEVASPEMIEGVMNLNAHIEEWEGEVDSGFSAEAYRFHIEAHKAREAMKKDS